MDLNKIRATRAINTTKKYISLSRSRMEKEAICRNKRGEADERINAEF